jgi:SagB-type dehydrogenase family enzyme
MAASDALRRRGFPEGAEAAEVFHRESALGPQSAARLRERVEHWAATEGAAAPRVDHPDAEIVHLPKPRFLKRMGFFDSLLRRRRSTRELVGPPLSLREVSALLWAADGIMAPIAEDGVQHRSHPTAGGLESTSLYFSSAQGAIPEGTWRYEADPHALVQCSKMTPRELSNSLLVPGNAKEWPNLVIFTSRLDPLLKKYGDRGYRFALLEIGHAAQNLLLAATGLGLGAVPIGGYYDEALRDVVQTVNNEQIMYVVGLGRNV